MSSPRSIAETRISVADDVEAVRPLDADGLQALEAVGERRSMAPGEYLYREGDEGDATYDFYAILTGAVEVVVGSHGAERTIVRHERHPEGHGRHRPRSRMMMSL